MRDVIIGAIAIGVAGYHYWMNRSIRRAIYQVRDALERMENRSSDE